MQKLFVLGSTGMLGQMVTRFFREEGSFDVIPVGLRFNVAGLRSAFSVYSDLAPAIFINCIGAIPQRLSSELDYILSNALIPIELGRSLSEKHILVHPSTDCVFSGLAGPYPHSSVADPSDTYGWSKLLGERGLLSRNNTLIVRTSIIGPNSVGAHGLLQWFLAQPLNATVNGFSNHLWNGITTLQWCKEVLFLLAERRYELGQTPQNRLIQLGTPEARTKFELLRLTAEFFRPDIEVLPIDHPIGVDRRLVPTNLCPSLDSQFHELRARLGQ